MYSKMPVIVILEVNLASEEVLRRVHVIYMLFIAHASKLCGETREIRYPRYHHKVYPWRGHTEKHLKTRRVA